MWPGSFRGSQGRAATVGHDKGGRSVWVVLEEGFDFGEIARSAVGGIGNFRVVIADEKKEDEVESCGFHRSCGLRDKANNSPRSEWRIANCTNGAYDEFLTQ